MRHEERARMVGTSLDLEVGPVAHGGSCVARHEGLVVFVRHALPGERVRAVVTEQRRSYLRADAVQVHVPSPDRVRPPCPVAGPGLCGGCDWQHATLAAQRQLKAQVVEEQLRRLAGLVRSVEVEPVPGDADGLGWRTRTRFAVDSDGAVGLRRHRSREIQRVDGCPITHPAVEELGVERRRWPGVSEVEAVAGVSGGVDAGDRAVVLHPPRRGAPAGAPPLDAPAAVAREERGGVRKLAGRGYVREAAAGRRWRVSHGAFWQVHPGAADRLVDAVLAGLEPRRGQSALDLYCGVGLFAGVLGERVGPTGRVVGVEADRRAAADARRNLADLSQVRVETGRVPATLDRLRLGRADLVVLDPPRSGAGRRVLDQLSEIRVGRIAYVACDPAMLGRDLALLAGQGWHLSGLRAFDIFPMTHHVETVAILT